MSTELVLFWAFAILTALSAVGVVAAKSPITSAMSLVATFFFLAGIYVLLWAHTIAVIQVLVYAGAIMVLFLFVIMLLSLTEVGPGVKVTGSRVMGGMAAVGLFGALMMAILRSPDKAMRFNDDALHSFGGLQSLGSIVYTQYLLPFEAVSLLLLVAIVGAVVVAKPRI